MTANDHGWVGVDPHAPAIEKQREYLAENNGIAGLEICAPDEIERATRLFYRDGFVVVADVLNRQQLKYINDGCNRVIDEMMALDLNREGNRGSHRYSFGGASRTGHQMHHPEWTMLIDLPTVTPIVTSIFGSNDYITRGGGGDFCLPGAVDYQPLHSDMNDRQVISHNNRDYVFGSFKDPRGLLTYRDLPCPYVCCNFLMVDFTELNGPTRQIPGTQHSHEEIPNLEEEPEWMKLSTVCPVPRGGVLVRDIRAWHGGTPNLSDEVRAMPNVEYYAPWFREPMNPAIPKSLYQKLSDHGKRVARYIVEDVEQPLTTGYRRSFGGTPAVFDKDGDTDDLMT